jgi:diadenylate cyclase
MSEVSDAIVVVVSEETGGISIAHDSVIRRNIEPERLAVTIRRMMRINDRRRDEADEEPQR